MDPHGKLGIVELILDFSQILGKIKGVADKFD